MKIKLSISLLPLILFPLFISMVQAEKFYLEKGSCNYMPYVNLRGPNIHWFHEVQQYPFQWCLIRKDFLESGTITNKFVLSSPSVYGRPGRYLGNVISDVYTTFGVLDNKSIYIRSDLTSQPWNNYYYNSLLGGSSKIDGDGGSSIVKSNRLSDNYKNWNIEQEDNDGGEFLKYLIQFYDNDSLIASSVTDECDISLTPAKVGDSVDQLCKYVLQGKIPPFPPSMSLTGDSNKKIVQMGECRYQNDRDHRLPIILWGVDSSNGVILAVKKDRSSRQEPVPVLKSKVENAQLVSVKFKKALPDNIYDEEPVLHTWTLAFEKGRWELSRSKKLKKIYADIDCTIPDLPKETRPEGKDEN